MSASAKKASSSNDSWRDVITEWLPKLVSHETWRNSDGSNENTVKENLGEIKAIFDGRMEDFNKNTSPVEISSFEWKGTGKDEKYWVFGYRAGKGKRKVSLICHLDTVPPGDGWNPFESKVESRLYKGVTTDFLTGRGSIDDKGPALVAFEAFTRTLRKARENWGDVENNVTLEVLFDTSEETDMSTPHYFQTMPDDKPTLGIVFDAFWSVRAEKGIERPIFTIKPKGKVPKGKLVIEKLVTSDGSVNMIPVTAEAHIKGSDEKQVDKFVDNINLWYRTCPFDDPDYHPADISVTRTGLEVIITAKVSGAQHGSAPHQNRSNGANPVVSLTNFLAFLVDRDILANNHNGEICKFIRWAFGTKVFGENQPDLLYRFDTIFGEGNGTTYSLTKLAEGKDGATSLYLDIRYAIGHHGKGWDGSEGKIKGDSLFKSIFEELTKNYKNHTGDDIDIECTTTTSYGPDIRSTHNAELFKINTAYRSIMGENCPMQAIGGGTDAHGWLELVTAGALFTDNLGPPINYHGINEGAPIIDLENSGEILLYMLTQELGIPEDKNKSLNGLHQCNGCCI